MNSKKYFDEVAHQWDNMQQSFFSEIVRDKALSAAKGEERQDCSRCWSGEWFYHPRIDSWRPRGDCCGPIRSDVGWDEKEVFWYWRNQIPTGWSWEITHSWRSSWLCFCQHVHPSCWVSVEGHKRDGADIEAWW